MNKEQIENLKEEIIDALHDSMDVDDNSVDIRLFEINLTSVLEWTFNTNQENLPDSTNGYTYYPLEHKTIFNTKEK